MKALRDGPPTVRAARFQELVQAEANGIVSDAWRAGLDLADEGEEIERSLGVIRDGWERDFEQLQALLDYPGQLGFEEALLALTLRSELELVVAWLDPETHARLRSLDASLASTLRASEPASTEARGRASRSLAAALPSHWWWRQS